MIESYYIIAMRRMHYRSELVQTGERVTIKIINVTRFRLEW